MRNKVVDIHDAKTQLRASALDDPRLRVDEYAFDGPIGKITNEDIDRIVYGY